MSTPQDVSEIEQRRQQAQRRRMRVLGNQKSRMETVGGKELEEESDIQEIYTPGATASLEKERAKRANGFWNDIILVLRAICFLAIFPVAFLSALIAFKNNCDCWSPSTLDDLNPILRGLLELCPSKLPPFALFVSLEALTITLTDLAPYYFLGFPSTRNGVSSISSLIALLGGSAQISALGGALVNAYNVGRVLIRLVKEFAVYLVAWQLTTVWLRWAFH